MNVVKTKSKYEVAEEFCEQFSTLPYIGEIIGIMPMCAKMMKAIHEHKYKLHIGTTITLVIGTVCLVIPKEKISIMDKLNKNVILSLIMQSLRAELGKYADQISWNNIEWEEVEAEHL